VDYIGHYINGSWTDIISVIVALIYAGVRWRRAPTRRLSRSLGLEAMHGLALFPLILMFASIFSDVAWDAVKSTSRTILGIAALIAVLAMLEEDEKPKPQPPSAERVNDFETPGVMRLASKRV
jgi:hypothetical protein